MTALPIVSLEDKYEVREGQALIAGRQALVRLPLLQRALDERAGRNTAGYISGYRGSPLGSFDAELWKASKVLAANRIVFDPGLNEDIALTAVAGTQQIDFVPGKTVEGVFGIWYGKGPGVDRSGDAIKHANLAGTSPLGGVVLVFGDDHAGKSSTTSHQSDQTLASWGVPILYPSSVSEVLTLGLAAIAMSRASGALVGLKVVNETAEATAVVDLGLPAEFEAPRDVADVHIRPEFLAMHRQEVRLHDLKLPRAVTFARMNGLDGIRYGSSDPKLMIATSGKAFADVLDALTVLGLNEAECHAAGIGVYKIALLHPLDTDTMMAAAKSAAEVLFVEEKQPHAELLAKQALFNAAERFAISGKTTPSGEPLLPSTSVLNGKLVASAIAQRLRVVLPDSPVTTPETPKALVAQGLKPLPASVRRPEFCAGCPHNSSTKVPEGSIGSTGIGCHGMAVFHPERNPLPMSQMGAEGASWIGLSRFTETPHIFQNLGDGTYNHSGSLAIRAAVQAKVNVTFKILFNDAVAMTGGQPVEGQLSVSGIVRQVAAEGIRRVVVLSEDPERFARERLPAGTELRHRDELATVQEALRQEPGVTVLVFDQVCAAEKRRRRKIGEFPNPNRRIFINALVCEGCGDCSVQSNCMAIEPLETALGLKRHIDQSACNKDYSCKKGFCPSFLTIEGGQPRKSKSLGVGDPMPPEPALPEVGGAFGILIAGVGGTGVVTIGAILGMAARIQGLGVSLFDMTGLSQKGGAVFSHVRFSTDQDAAMAARIGPQGAETIIACDLVAATQSEALETISPSTLIVGNEDVAATASFIADRDAIPSPGDLLARLEQAGASSVRSIAATGLAETLFGDSIATNMMMLGFAWQLGGIPLSRDAIEEAIRLNGRAVASNLQAFAAGRSAADAERRVEVPPPDLDTFIAQRREDLVRYWNARYAKRYEDLVTAVRDASSRLASGEALGWAVARSAYKLMAYKDEYEVARLYTDGRFRQMLEAEFEDAGSLKVHLSPPIFARHDPNTGRPRKYAFGSWIFPVFRTLAAARRLREGPLDIFGRSADRRLERELRDAFIGALEAALPDLAQADADRLLGLAEAALEVRGFGVVKDVPAKQLLDRLRDFVPGGAGRVTPRALELA